jgi:hypothetical protein
MLAVIWRWLNIRKVARFSDEIGDIRKDTWLKKAGKKK